MKIKFITLILSLIYCGYLSIFLIASFHDSVVLNPLNSEYYFRSGNLIKAIENEPTQAKYHLYYGLELVKILPQDKFSAQNQLRLAKKEFYRAVKCKPYSQLYKKVYDIYSIWIDGQL